MRIDKLGQVEVRRMSEDNGKTNEAREIAAAFDAPTDEAQVDDAFEIWLRGEAAATYDNPIKSPRSKQASFRLARAEISYLPSQPQIRSAINMVGASIFATTAKRVMQSSAPLPRWSEGS